MSALPWPYPIHLYLVRHGESEGNLYPSLYRSKGDHAIRLSPTGVIQAQEDGVFLAERLFEEYQAAPETFGKIRAWSSTFYRARETNGYILGSLGEKFDYTPGTGILSYREDHFLIEQKAGLFDGLSRDEFRRLYPDMAETYDRYERNNGRFYAPTPMGDSQLDVTIRLKHFLGTVARDAQKNGIRHVIVVCHGVTLRCFVAVLMRHSPEWMNAETNPGNGWTRYLHGDPINGYRDEGYIFGRGAPLNYPAATQVLRPHVEDVFMLTPNRPGAVIPPGVTPWDPFAKGPKE